MIYYTEGDATRPKGAGIKLILHCCNDVGVWGAGFVLALSARWPNPEFRYLTWAQQETGLADTTGEFELGQCQFVIVEPDIVVVNMIGQAGVVDPTAKVRAPVRYWALDRCLAHVVEYGDALTRWSVHCPRFGAGLAKGHWDEVEYLLEQRIGKTGIPVTVYDLPREKK